MAICVASKAYQKEGVLCREEAPLEQRAEGIGGPARGAGFLQQVLLLGTLCSKIGALRKTQGYGTPHLAAPRPSPNRSQAASQTPAPGYQALPFASFSTMFHLQCVTPSPNILVVRETSCGENNLG